VLTDPAKAAAFLTATRPRGRPSKVSPEIVAQVHLATTENPYLGGKALAGSVVELTNSSISAQTVNSIRHAL
jgi:hypothetical protein